MFIIKPFSFPEGVLSDGEYDRDDENDRDDEDGEEKCDDEDDEENCDDEDGEEKCDDEDDEENCDDEDGEENDDGDDDHELFVFGLSSSKNLSPSFSTIAEQPLKSIAKHTAAVVIKTRFFIDVPLSKMNNVLIC